MHPTLSGNKKDGKDDWDDVLESQRLFMQRRDRQKPAATVVKIPPVEKDIIELETPLNKINIRDATSTGPSNNNNNNDNNNNNNNNNKKNISRPPVETDVIDVISDIVEREINPTIYKPPSFSNTSGFPSVFKRSKGPILSRKRNKNISSFKESRSKSKFSQMLEKERKNQSEMAATNGNVDIDKIEIHQENLQRLASMTKTEIEQARNDLMSSMSPNLLALFKKKQDKNMKKNQQQKPKQSEEKEKLIKQQYVNLSDEKEISTKKNYKMKKTNNNNNNNNNTAAKMNRTAIQPSSFASKSLATKKNDNTIFTNITTEDDLDNAIVTCLPELEKEKLSWTGKVGQQPKPKSKLFYKVQPRFDLKGIRVMLSSNIDDDSEKNKKKTNDRIRKVGEQEGEIYGLYHHGQDPDQPGYTFSELLHLSRSVVTAQRLTALRAILFILEKRRNNLNNQPCPEKLSPKLGDILLMGLNSNINSVIQNSIDAIYFWLVPDKFVKLNEANPQYRRYELYPHVSIAQDNANPSVKLTPVTDPFGDDVMSRKAGNQEDEETTEEGKLAKLKEDDPIRWLLRNGILETYTRILTSDEIFQIDVYKHALDSLTYIASHSKVVALQIWESSQLIKIIRHRFIEGNDKLYGYSLASQSIRLLRTLCQSNFTIASDTIKYGISESIKRYFIGPELFVKKNSKNYSEWESCLLESLQLWRICLLYGLDQDSVQNMMRSIHNIITKCKDNKMSFSNNFGILVERFMYSIYSAYCISIHQSINDVKAVPESVYNETKVHVTEAVKLLSSFSKRSNNGSTTSIDYFRLSGPLHFLATYLNLGTFNQELYENICKNISILILSVNNKTKYFANLSSKMIELNDTDSTSSYFIDCMHGMIRCLEALLKNEKLNEKLKFDKSVHSTFSSSILRFISEYFLTKDTTNSTKHEIIWNGLTPYENRPFVLLLSNAIIYVRKVYLSYNESREMPSEEKKNGMLDVLSDATLLLISKILPGDEYIFMNSINLFLTLCLERKRIDTKSISIDDINTMKIYFSSFAGSRIVQDHSARLFSLQSTSIALDKTFSIIPRSRGQIPSVLPLPIHWLWVPLTLDGSAQAETFLNSIKFISSLELNGYFDRPTINFQLSPPIRAFCMMQVFLYDDGSFIFKKEFMPKTTEVMSNLFRRTNIMEVIKVCGAESTEALSKSLINIYFQSSYGNILSSKIILFMCKWRKIRKFLWRQGIKHRMLYLLESAFQSDNVNENNNTFLDLNAEEDDNNMIDLYCESIISLSIDKEKGPKFYNVILNRVKSYALKSSKWMRENWKERLGGEFCTW